MLCALLLLCAPLRADDVRPVQVQIVEREPGAFLVQWLVPKVLEPQAIPSPVLPPDCTPEGERVFLDQPGGWMVRQNYRCPEGLAGRTVGIRYPIHNPSLTTVIRVELLSGERFARALAPQEESWTLPEANVGAVEAWLKEAQASVRGGLRHVAGNGVHLALALVLILLGGMRGSFRDVTAFAGGQLIAVAATVLFDRTFDAVAAELCVAAAVVFLAREALRTERREIRLTTLTACAGLFHGLAFAADSWSEHLLGVLGVDAALLVLCLVGVAAARIVQRHRDAPRLRPLAAYLFGGAAIAFALTVTPASAPGEEAGPVSPRLPGIATSTGGGLPGSRRVAPATGVAPVQSFLSVEPFEIRHEVLIRLGDAARELGLEVDPAGVLPIEDQAEVIRILGEEVASRTRLLVDGEATEGLLDRASFMTADTAGVLPRQTAVPEVVADALVGVTLVYLTGGIPGELELSWREMGGAVPSIPATIVDPEASRSTLLTTEQPAVRWTNQLMDDPVPTVTGVAVEPPRLPVPLLSAVLLAAAAVLGVRSLRDRGAALPFGFARLALAGALLVTPLAQVSIGLPATLAGGVSDAEARRILAGVLPNVYRAFEFREESAVYDRLAVAVTGDVLSEVYLQHRRALEMEERGGARARVDAVEVVEAGAVEPLENGGFGMRASWTVGGSVTHFGHRHFRQNRYHAAVGVVPVDGHWKIASIEVLEQERLR